METKTETPPAVPAVDGTNNVGLPTAADVNVATPPGSVPPAQSPPTEPANSLGSAPETDPQAPPANTLGSAPEPKTPETTPVTPAKVEGVPDSYQTFNNAPEGFAMDDGTTKLFQAAGLTQEGAEVIISGLRDRQAEDATLRQQQLVNKHLEDVTTLKQDVQFGGIHYDKTLKDGVAGMNRMTQMMGNDNLWKAIDAADLKSHPEVVKLFAMIEKWHGEKSFLTGENNSPDPFGSDPMSNLARMTAAELAQYRAGK